MRYFDPMFTSAPAAPSAPNHPYSTSAQTSSSSSGSEQGTDECDGSSTKSTKRYRAKCDRCPRTFKTKALLNEHLTGHEGGTLVFCPTPGCGNGYPTPREIKVHLVCVFAGVVVAAVVRFQGVPTNPQHRRPPAAAVRARAMTSMGFTLAVPTLKETRAPSRSSGPAKGEPGYSKIGRNRCLKGLTENTVVTLRRTSFIGSVGRLEWP